MTRFFAWSSTHEHCRRPRVYGTRKAVPQLAQTRDKHGPLGLGGRRADKPHSNARKHTRRHGRRAQSHPHCGHGGSWAVQVVLAGRYPSTSVRRSSSRSRLQLLVEGVGEMRCDLSSVQQHVRVDHVHVEERCAQYKLVPSSTSGDSTLQAQAILLKRVAPLLSQKRAAFLHCGTTRFCRALASASLLFRSLQ